MGNFGQSLQGMSGQALGKPLQMAAWAVAALGALYLLYGLFTDNLFNDFLDRFFYTVQGTMAFVVAFVVLMVGGKYLERA